MCPVAVEKYAAAAKLDKPPRARTRSPQDKHSERPGDTAATSHNTLLAPTPQPARKESTMIDIASFVFARHLRAEPTHHVLFFKGGEKRAAGRGLAFWFLPLGASIAVLPLDDREQSFVFRARSADFQEVSVNGVITWRVQNPEEAAARVDFSVDTKTGVYQKEPLDRVAGGVTHLAQQLAGTWLNTLPLKEVLKDGGDGLRACIHDGLHNDAGLREMGIAVVATRVSSVAPSAEMEKALQMPTRESIQQSADEATFSRRALAVDKERAIQENELANQIELARREEQLIAQRGLNERKRAQETAESKHIEAESAADNLRLNATAQAESIHLLEEAKVEAERNRMAIYRDLPPAALLGLAARELAQKLTSIEHLSLTPDVLGSLLQRVLAGQADKLRADAE